MPDNPVVEAQSRSGVPHRWRTEVCAVIFYVLLTVVMTWPWAVQIRNATPDEDDAYAHAYFLWWGYHQTFHDPLRLSHATIFYPFADSYAFGENDYGISIFCFPLFALGLRPLMVHGLAVLAGFAFTGYGMFRLTRTLTGNTCAALVAGTAFAFVPYRFDHLAHLPLIFTGWLPLLFEALFLFLRRRSGRRALWLGVAFFFNALTCATWAVLTPLPFALTFALAAARDGRWRDGALWRRGGLALGTAGLALLPFFLPFVRVARTHGFVRQLSDVAQYSAQLSHWLTPARANRLWQHFYTGPYPNELTLFPGVLLLLLALCALVVPLARPRRDAETAAPGRFQRAPLRYSALWIALGVSGSLGVNFIFYRLLYEFLPFLRAMRVAARWAMFCYLGLALLAGVGAWQLAQLLAARNPRGRSVVYAVVLALLLGEQWAAPLHLLPGAAEPDPLTQRLAATPMHGGIFELPAGDPSDFRSMLRAADHARPVVNSSSSFVPPLTNELVRLANANPVPSRLLDSLEEIGVSYLTVHGGALSPSAYPPLKTFLQGNLTAGRLRFIARFPAAPRDGAGSFDDLYALTRTEPAASGSAALPPMPEEEAIRHNLADLPPDFREAAYLICRLTRLTYGRGPTYAEFQRDYERLKNLSGSPSAPWAEQVSALAAAWVRLPEVRDTLAQRTPQESWNLLTQQTPLADTEAAAPKSLAAEDYRAWLQRALTTYPVTGFDETYLLLHYFAYLRRDPDESGLAYWLAGLQQGFQVRGLHHDFLASEECRRKNGWLP